MADRYWVGGTGSWDNTAGTKWSTTSGGAGGAAVPTEFDDVFFDANSTGTITVSDFLSPPASAKTINFTGFTGTFVGSQNSVLVMYGNVTLVSGMTFSNNGSWSFLANATFISAGKNIGQIAVSSGAVVTLGDALTATSSSQSQITIFEGTFDTANYAVTTRRLLYSSSSTSGVFEFGSSTITLTRRGEGITFSKTTNLTVNPGTSNIVLNNDIASIAITGSATFYNVSFTSTIIESSPRAISGTLTFNNLTLTADSTGGLTEYVITGDQTITGTLTCSGGSILKRGFLSSVSGATLTVANMSADNCDFLNITIAGGAAPTTPANAGDCGGNSGIVFPAAKTVYRVGTSNTWGGSSSWATSSGGAGSDNNFPLPQDTAIVDNSTPSAGAAISFSTRANVGFFDASTRTSSMSVTVGTTRVYGSFRLGSGTTSISGSTSLVLRPNNITLPLNTQGLSTAVQVIIDGVNGGIVQLQSALTTTNQIQMIGGTFDAVSYNVTANFFDTNSLLTSTRTVSMGSGLWTLTRTSGTVWSASGANVTVNKNTADIAFSTTSSGTISFFGNDFSYNAIRFSAQSGGSTLIIYDSNTFTEIGSAKTVAYTIQFDENGNTIGSWGARGSSGQLLTLRSTSTGVQIDFNLTNTTNNIDFLSVRDIKCNQTDTFYVGPNSTNVSNNTNVIFSFPPSSGMMMMFA